jgi:hypothetical protein
VCVCDGVDLLSIHCGSQSGHCGGAGGGEGGVPARLSPHSGCMVPPACGQSIVGLL